jgi:hypothetical protein
MCLGPRPVPKDRLPIVNQSLLGGRENAPVMAAGEGATTTTAGGFGRAGARLGLQLEDWLLFAAVALASPLLAMIEGPAGPFDTGRPLEGAVRLVGVCGALACLATRSSDRPEPEEPILTSATFGPIAGALALVGASAFAALSLPPEPAFGLTFGAGILIAVARDHLPTVPVATRRMLAMPFLWAAAGIFWSLVHSVVGAVDVRAQLGGEPAVFGLAFGILALASAIYYAMLVYAPRQIVEREGSPRRWLIRYGLFVVSVAFGLSWLAIV